MDSPVVIRMVEVLTGLGLATLRFNFRGVGTSTGRHDEGRGEQDDARAALDHLRAALGGTGRVAIAGYSFGAAIAAAVATTAPVAGLALVAPPLRVAQIALPTGLTAPTLVVVGAEDQYCPPAALEDLRIGMPSASVVVIEGADHFFFGSLTPLGEAISAWIDALA
jgi:hypothetical protein